MQKVLLKYRHSDGTEFLQAKQSGQTHFNMEESGKPSHWNTLRTLKVLKQSGFGVVL